MGFFAVLYTYAAQPAELDALRPRHRAFLGDLYHKGLVAIAGPLGEPGGAGGLIVVRATSLEEATAMMNEDPFWTADLVAARLIRPWTEVFGPLTLDA